MVRKRVVLGENALALEPLVLAPESWYHWLLVRSNREKLLLGQRHNRQHNDTNNSSLGFLVSDRIPSTTPGAEPPRDAKDSGSARSHSTHLETSSSNRP